MADTRSIWEHSPIPATTPVRWGMSWVRIGDTFELPATAVIVSEELVSDHANEYAVQVVWRDLA